MQHRIYSVGNLDDFPPQISSHFVLEAQSSAAYVLSFSVTDCSVPAMPRTVHSPRRHLLSQDLSLFTGIRPLSSGYVPFHQDTSPFHEKMSVITDGVYELLDADNENVYTYLRKGKGETLVVVVNFMDRTVPYHVDDVVKVDTGNLVISNYKEAPEEFRHDIELEPYGAYVYAVKS